MLYGMRRLRIVLLQVTLAVVSTLAAAELTLQVLAIAKPWWGSRATGPVAGSDTYTVLCLGDSHTYGAPLPEAESYPGQLQARLDAESPGRYRVVNLGVPGMNTAMVAHRFRDNLLRYQPDLVIFWVGVNNIWNRSETEHWGGDRVEGWLSDALGRSKLVRLVRVLGVGGAAPSRGRVSQAGERTPGSPSRWHVGNQTIEIEVGPQERVEKAHAEAGARMDLTYLLEVARTSQIPVILVTYPLAIHDHANEAIRSVTGELNVDMIDSAEDFERARRDGFAFADLIVNAVGPHPRATLYRYVVDSMLPVVLRHLPPPDRGRMPGGHADAR
jgi:hypothetical protein